MTSGKDKEKETGFDRPFDPTSLLDYQEGAIVSMTLADTPGGTITVFAFAKGQGLSEHTAPFDALAQVIDGKAAVTIGGRRHSVARGEAILMPADIPHAVRAEEDFKMMLTMIKSRKV